MNQNTKSFLKLAYRNNKINYIFVKVYKIVCIISDKYIPVCLVINGINPRQIPTIMTVINIIIKPVFENKAFILNNKLQFIKNCIIVKRIFFIITYH